LYHPVIANKEIERQMINTVYVIHHAHTDIGYTHGQSRIVRYHKDFIRQAMGIAAQHERFAWTCETFFAVEQFWQDATAAERERFVALVKAGRIGLTGAYFHMTELPNAALLEALALRARSFAQDAGVAIDSAMHADINGCQLAEARALARMGVKFLLTCVHPHHGYVPFGRRQELFRWNLGEGLELLVCHADQYMTGNELGLAPGAEFNYTAGFSDPPVPFDEDVLERRLPIYLERVTASGWGHDFVVLAASGLFTDNSPPSQAVAERIDRWNERHGKSVRIEMTTPSRLGAIIARSAAQLPVHQGDWPDWWADGVACDPEGVALFRQAQRERNWLEALAAARPECQIDLRSLDQSLALAAEHTFGHSDSVSHPWNHVASQLRLKKLSYIAEAADQAEVLIDQAGDLLGGGALSYNRSTVFRAVNPYPWPVRDLVELELEACELKRWKLEGAVRVVRKASGLVLPHQLELTMRGKKALVDLTLGANESVDLAIEPDDRAVEEVDLRPRVPDRTRDLRVNNADVPPTRLATEWVEIQWASQEGIIGWRDLKTGKELIDAEAGANPFTLRASRLHSKMDGPTQCLARKKLGRNRNGRDAEWGRSRLLRAISGSQGEHVDGVVLDYEMPGFEMLQVLLNARKREPRVDVEVRMHKIGTWDVENVYLSLPFSAGPGAELWFDRGMAMRPGHDQLPGTLLDYCGVQDGFAWCAPRFGIAVAQLDSHLIQRGPLEYGVRDLVGEVEGNSRPGDIYAWLMTNYWETNFSPEVGGFYSFRFSVLWGEHLSEASKALEACRSATTGVRAVHLR
jgi:hypothetical protein